MYRNKHVQFVRHNLRAHMKCFRGVNINRLLIGAGVQFVVECIYLLDFISKILRLKYFTEYRKLEIQYSKSRYYMPIKLTCPPAIDKFFSRTS